MGGWSGLGGLQPRDVMLKPWRRVYWFIGNSYIAKPIIHTRKNTDLSFVWFVLLILRNF